MSVEAAGAAAVAASPEAAVALVAGTAALFALTRLPRERVALAALVAGVALGAVPAADAFQGFGDDAAVTLAAFMLVSGAVVRSGVADLAARPLLRALSAEGQASSRAGRLAVPALAGVAALLSAAVRDVAAARLLLPFAGQFSRAAGRPRAALLLPAAFAAVLGGTATLVGTPANLVVSRFRARSGEGAFGLFAFLPVGLAVALAGMAFLAWGWRLLPRRDGGEDARGALGPRAVLAEARVPADSAQAGRSVAALEAAAGGAVRVSLILRERFHRVEPAPDRLILEGDVLLLLGEPDGLERLVSEAGLVLQGDGVEPVAASDADGTAGRNAAAVREGLVAIGSPLVGATAVTAQLRARYGLALLALGRRNPPPPRRLAFLRFEAGDVLVLKGAADRLADGMEALRMVPLSDRPVALGARRRSWEPAMVLGIAAALAAAGTMPVSVAFVGAAVAAIMLDGGAAGNGADAGWRGVEWRTVAVLAALIPLADAMVRSGAAGVAADAAARAGAGVSPLVLLAIVIGMAGLLASWTGSILAALVLAPVAAGGAARLGLPADAFLMAVALGATCGFLDPRGRAAAGLVRAPGGYSASDYRRLGAPLLATVAAAGALAIAAAWGTGGR